MATSRQERMQERMRGAHSHQVEDISFAFEIPIVESDPPQQEPEPTPQTHLLIPPPAAVNASVKRTTPNTSAKRRRLDGDSANEVTASSQSRSLPPPPPPPPPPSVPIPAAQEEPRAPSPARQPERRRDIYDLPEHSDDEKIPRSSDRRSSTLRSAPSSARAGNGVHPSQSVASVVSMAPAPRSSSRLAASSSQRPTTRRSPPIVTASAPAEEVAESPKHLPGSGRRRPIPVPVSLSSSSPYSTQSTSLGANGEGTDEEERSSPLVRKLRRSTAAAAEASAAGGVRRSTRLSNESVPSNEEVAESEPELEPEPEPEPARNKSLRSGRKEPSLRNSVKAAEEPDDNQALSLAEAEVEAEAEEPEEAQAIDDKEAARLLGRKRPRGRSRLASPDLGTDPPAAADGGEPSVKRRRKRPAPLDSPAVQQQPKPKVKKSKPQDPNKRARNAETQKEEDEVIAVMVQRFKRTRQADEHPEGKDAFDLQIPFASRAGVNAIDVLSAACEELIESYLTRLEDQIGKVEDAATKREYRTKQRALEAFREDLRPRLLEHTIALDTLHALRKRVRATQKEKFTLREEILRVRAERDQVALRIDATRIKHEKNSKEALRRITLSSTMHDIDMAIEKGQEIRKLSAAEQKAADLANIELLVSRVADQACTNSGNGGALKQIKDFNAFLERAAMVLESR